MKYAVRSLKYLLLICVLYVALLWASSIYTYDGMVDVVTLIRAQFGSDRGVWLVVAFVALALFYPRFGYVRRVVAGVDIEADRIRIDNAMKLYGFKFAEVREGRLVYRAEGIIRRITLLFEDEILVRVVEGGVEIEGLRRSAVRIIYQLNAYIEHKERY
ncbi:MAG: hypothetical protein J6U93_07380 [Alistipes sp.]|nr:hypothetical protein [Alistipes sp.]